LEFYQLDELPITLIVLAMALTWFAARRWRNARFELSLRLAAERELEGREARYRTLFAENLAGTAILDARGTVRLANPAIAAMLGLASPEAAVGMELQRVLADAGVLTGVLGPARGQGRSDYPDLKLTSADGRPLEAMARFVAHEPEDGSAEIYAYFADVTELQLVQRELADALAKNRVLTQKYVQAQEEERRHLARELHDEMGQYLNAIKLDAVAIRDSGLLRSSKVEDSLYAIISATDHVYSVVRDLTQRLRPVALDTLGLSDALRHCVSEWQRRNPAVDCRLSLEGALTDVPEPPAITVYRLVQECLTNITRHAQATRVSIELVRDRCGTVLMTVSDNGVGADPSRRTTGVGLHGLRERVEGLGGTFQVRAGAPGFEVVARVPTGSSDS
jgi:PAS domain S-box-containing protein